MCLIFFVCLFFWGGGDKNCLSFNIFSLTTKSSWFLIFQASNSSFCYHLIISFPKYLFSVHLLFLLPSPFISNSFSVFLFPQILSAADWIFQAQFPRERPLSHWPRRRYYHLVCRGWQPRPPPSTPQQCLIQRLIGDSPLASLLHHPCPPVSFSRARGWRWLTQHTPHVTSTLHLLTFVTLCYGYTYHLSIQSGN